jgi:hypothetical protein
LREEEAALVSFVATKSFLFLEKKKSRSAPADKRFSIDEASSVIRRARGRTIQEKKKKRREHAPHADAGVRRTQIDPDRWSF